MKLSEAARIQSAPAGTGADRLYSSQELLARANRWAAAHGFDPITPATFQELRKERILPEPSRIGRGRGGGKGAAWGWPVLAYRRLLRVWQLRAQGWTYRSAQRAALFIMGADLSPELVKADLIRVFERQTRKTSREYGTTTWRPGERLPPKAQAELQAMIDSGLVQPFLDMVGVQLPAELMDEFRRMVESPDLPMVFGQILAEVLTPPGLNPTTPLKKAMRHVPPQVASILADDFEEWSRTLTGVLAHPEAGNAIVLAIQALPLMDLMVLRAYTREWPAMVKAIRTLLAALPTDDLEGQVAQRLAVQIEAQARTWRTPELLMLLGFFAARSASTPGFTAKARLAVVSKMSEVLFEAQRRGLLSSQLEPLAFQQLLTDLKVPPSAWHVWGIDQR